MDLPTQQQYPYRPLNLPYETRILTVQPAKVWEDPITCSLSHITLPTRTGTGAPPGTEPSSPMRDGEHTDSDKTPYDALSYCWSQGVTNISKGKPPPDPETVSTTCTLRTDADGNQVFEHGTTVFKDTLDDPVWHFSYISSGGPLPAGEILCGGIPFAVGGELHRALLRLRPYYPKPQEVICPGCPDCPGFDPENNNSSSSTSTVKPLRIWIDAICINQSDPVERNQHVRMMSQIYRSASHVHIWLGEQSGVEDRLVEFLFKADEILATAIRQVAASGRFTGNPQSEAEGVAIQQAFMAEYNAQGYGSGAERVDPLDWDALTEVLEHRSWFTRTWIVQEAANARSASFRMGNCEIGWGLLAVVISSLRRYRVDAMVAHCDAIKAICMMEHLRLEIVQRKLEGSRMSLVPLLEEFRGLKSTIASDKIYGILGLTQGAEKDSLVVDYEKSCEEVFVDFAVERLVGNDPGGDENGSVEILSHCVMVSPYGDPVLDLPSWVPDWTRPGFVEPFSIRELEANACGGLTAPGLTISADKKTLTVKGYLVDTIAEIEADTPIPLVMESLANVSDLHPEYPKSEPRLLDEDGKPKTLNALRSERYHALQEKIHRNIMRIAFPENVSTADTWEALWRTFMCNRTRENEIPDNSDRYRGGDGFDVALGAHLQQTTDETVIGRRLQHQRECHGLVSGSNEEQKWLDGLWKAAEMVRQGHSKWCRHRRFVRSVSGRYGWVLHGTEVGDKVVVLKGGKWPFVLREIKTVNGGDENKTRYRIVGDCYLHGTMEGEVVAEGSGYDEVEVIIV